MNSSLVLSLFLASFYDSVTGFIPLVSPCCFSFLHLIITLAIFGFAQSLLLHFLLTCNSSSCLSFLSLTSFSFLSLSCLSFYPTLSPVIFQSGAFKRNFSSPLLTNDLFGVVKETPPAQGENITCATPCLVVLHSFTSPLQEIKRYRRDSIYFTPIVSFIRIPDFILPLTGYFIHLPVNNM